MRRIGRRAAVKGPRRWLPREEEDGAEWGSGKTDENRKEQEAVEKIGKEDYSVRNAFRSYGSEIFTRII